VKNCFQLKKHNEKDFTFSGELSHLSEAFWCGYNFALVGVAI
jgi:hypothetical protein